MLIITCKTMPIVSPRDHKEVIAKDLLDNTVTEKVFVKNCEFTAQIPRNASLSKKEYNSHGIIFLELYWTWYEIVIE